MVFVYVFLMQEGVSYILESSGEGDYADEGVIHRPVWDWNWLLRRHVNPRRKSNNGWFALILYSEGIKKIDLHILKVLRLWSNRPLKVPLIFRAKKKLHKILKACEIKSRFFFFFCLRRRFQRTVFTSRGGIWARLRHVALPDKARGAAGGGTSPPVNWQKVITGTGLNIAWPVNWYSQPVHNSSYIFS